jgi:hypothetical protein
MASQTVASWNSLKTMLTGIGALKREHSRFLAATAFLKETGHLAGVLMRR